MHSDVIARFITAICINSRCSTGQMNSLEHRTLTSIHTLIHTHCSSCRLPHATAPFRLPVYERSGDCGTTAVTCDRDILRVTVVGKDLSLEECISQLSDYCIHH